MFGSNLNFFHGVFVAAIFAVLANIVVSKMTQSDEQKSSLTFVGLGVFTEASLRTLITKVTLSLLLYALLGFLMWQEIAVPLVAALVASTWTWLMFINADLQSLLTASSKGRVQSLIREDKFWGGLLAACAIFMLFYFK